MQHLTQVRFAVLAWLRKVEWTNSCNAFARYASWDLLNLPSLSRYAIFASRSYVLRQRLQMNLFNSRGLTASLCAPSRLMVLGAEPEVLVELDETETWCCVWTALKL